MPPLAPYDNQGPTPHQIVTVDDGNQLRILELR
jgi:hypothetical protein